jgi:hypothetical protein
MIDERARYFARRFQIDPSNLGLYRKDSEFVVYDYDRDHGSLVLCVDAADSTNTFPMDIAEIDLRFIEIPDREIVSIEEA